MGVESWTCLLSLSPALILCFPFVLGASVEDHTVRWCVLSCGDGGLMVEVIIIVLWWVAVGDGDGVGVGCGICDVVEAVDTAHLVKDSIN